MYVVETRWLKQGGFSKTYYEKLFHMVVFGWVEGDSGHTSPSAGEGSFRPVQFSGQPVHFGVAALLALATRRGGHWCSFRLSTWRSVTGYADNRLPPRRRVLSASQPGKPGIILPCPWIALPDWSLDGRQVARQ